MNNLQGFTFATFCYTFIMKKETARGFSSLAVLVFVFVAVAIVGGGLYLSYNKIPFLQKLITGVDKSDPDWKVVYCSKELAKLPGPPFTYQKKSDMNRTGPSLYTRKMMPERLKFSDVITCSYSYRFEDKTAWPSVGVEYRNHIDNFNQFRDASAMLYTGFVNSGWKKLPRIPKDDSGIPHYVTDSFPLVFTRENRRLGTVEYLDVFPAVDFYVKLSIYEK